MPESSTRLRRWIILTVIAGLPRILGAFLLPNAFGDAYVYVRDAGTYSAKFASGTFALTDLYGFWLPLYQLICAAVIVVVGHPYFVAKVVSAVFGVGICHVIYAITWNLTKDPKSAFLAFLLVALSPLHIFNSASSMTDVPSAFFVLASLSFVLKKQWITAGVFGALAGLTRIDNWMLIALIPAIQLFRERRVSVPAICMLVFPPLFWFYISWKATGDWLACFVIRKQYMDALLIANPSLAGFSLFGVARDTASLLISIDVAVLTACFVGGWLVVKRMLASSTELQSKNLQSVVAILGFFFAYLGFIVLAYLTHKQPIIFPRYGLTMFAIGVPILPWTYRAITQAKPQLARKLLIAIIVTCVFGVTVQLVGSIGFINKVHTLGTVVDTVRSRVQSSPNSRVFSDEGTVIALSGLPEQHFVSTSEAPRDRDAFLTWLKEKNVEYVVFVEKEDSTLTRLFPELANGSGNEMFQPIMHASARFLPTSVWLYQLNVDKR